MINNLNKWFNAKFGWFFTNGVKARYKKITPYLYEVDITK